MTKKKLLPLTDDPSGRALPMGSLRMGNLWGSDKGSRNLFPSHKPYQKRDLGVPASRENKRTYNRLYWCRIRSPHRPSPTVRDGKHRKHPKLKYEVARKR